MIKVLPEAMEAIRTFLNERERPKSIRIQLQSTGCCDASLGLMADTIRAEDLTYDLQGITFMISHELCILAGDITIAYINEQHRTGFVLTSEKPINEWAGFGACTIKT